MPPRSGPALRVVLVAAAWPGRFHTCPHTAEWWHRPTPCPRAGTRRATRQRAESVHPVHAPHCHPRGRCRRSRLRASAVAALAGSWRRAPRRPDEVITVRVRCAVIAGLRAQMAHEGCGGLRVHLLVVVARVEIAPVRLPVGGDDVFHSHERGELAG
jgi:hypothetical protein